MSAATSAAEGSAGPRPTTRLERLFDLIARTTSVFASLICLALIATTTFSVVVYQRGITISWLDDLVRMLLIWLVFLGSIAPVWRRDHITMDALYMRFSPSMRRIVDGLIAIMGIVVCGFLTWVSTDTTWREYEFNTLLSSGEIPQWPQTFAIPFSFGLMTLIYLGVLLGAITGRTPASVPPPPDQA